MKIVLDTNVLVSGIINPNGKPAEILNLVVNEMLTSCLDSRIFSEYKVVLSSPKFSFPQKEIYIFSFFGCGNEKHFRGVNDVVEVL